MYNRASPETAAMMTRARDPFGHKAIKEWCYEADFAETELIGKWEIVDGQVQADATYERIEWLTTNCLEKIAASDGGWDALFRDPSDGRFWERTYPKGEIQGGGPSRLSVLSPEKAHAKYQFRQPARSNGP
jgi:hypothetical protein